MVVVTNKMKKSVDNHAVKLLVELGSELDGVLADAVDADEQVAGKLVTLAIVKGDDIGEIVVMKVADVDIKNIIIRTKDD